jgi:hypothetical protein
MSRVSCPSNENPENFGAWMSENGWNGKNPWEWVKYDWNEPPQPQLVVFCDLVGVDIAPVSKKSAVKFLESGWHYFYDGVPSV